GRLYRRSYSHGGDLSEAGSIVTAGIMMSILPSKEALLTGESSSMPVDSYFAHSRPGEPRERWELLSEHLTRVAVLADQFAGSFGSSEWGYLAGIWHDLGKYRLEFQRRIRGSGEQVEHAGIGA